MWKRKRKHDEVVRTVMNERQLEETRRRQARVLAQLKVLTQSVEEMIPTDGNGPAH
jgi:hypothetical protein